MKDFATCVYKYAKLEEHALEDSYMKCEHFNYTDTNVYIFL